MEPITELSDAITRALVGRCPGEDVRLEKMSPVPVSIVDDIALALIEKGDVVTYGPEFYHHVAKAISVRNVTSYGDCERSGVRAFWAKAGSDVYVFPGLGRRGAEPELLDP